MVQRVDAVALKSSGLIRQTDKDFFVARLRVPAGNLEAQRIVKAAELAEKYGRGYCHFTFQQSIEIPWVKIEDLEAFQSDLKEAGLSLASCGPRVRAVTACSGCRINPYGLVDAADLARRADELFFGQDTPHKFKVSYSACVIGCANPQENDLGFHEYWYPMLFVLRYDFESPEHTVLLGAMIANTHAIACGIEHVDDMVKTRHSGVVADRERGFPIDKLATIPDISSSACDAYHVFPHGDFALDFDEIPVISGTVFSVNEKPGPHVGHGETERLSAPDHGFLETIGRKSETVVLKTIQRRLVLRLGIFRFLRDRFLHLLIKHVVSIFFAPSIHDERRKPSNLDLYFADIQLFDFRDFCLCCHCSPLNN